MKTPKLLPFFLVFSLLFVSCEKVLPEQDDFSAAQEAYAQNDMPQAFRLSQRYLRDETNKEKRFRAWNILVGSSIRMGELKWSITYLEEMRQEYASDTLYLAQVLRKLAPLYETEHAWEQAARAWYTLITVEDMPENEAAQVYDKIGLLYHLAQNFPLSVDMLEMCLTMQADVQTTALCHFHLADALSSSILVDSIEIPPSEQDPKGEVQPKPQEQTQLLWDEAISHLEAALEAESLPASYQGQAWFLMGDILDQLKKPAEAQAAFQKALPLHPNAEVVQSRLAKFIKK